jgi:hypothetical protein
LIALKWAADIRRALNKDPKSGGSKPKKS